jgi:hypothetical protein
VAVVSCATGAIAWELYRDRALAVCAGLIVNATLLICIAALFATPDAPSVLFWTLTIWASAWLRRTGDTRIWLLIGSLAGLGCVSKYTNLFIGPGIIIWLVFDFEAPKRLVGPLMFAGSLIALAVFSSVIFWNFQHHWVSFGKQFGRIHDGHATLFYVFEFVTAQFGLANPAVAVLAGVGVKAAWKQRHFDSLPPGAFLLALSVPLVAYMLFHSFHSRVQGNWTPPVYPAMAVIAAEAAQNVAPSGQLSRAARWAGPAGIGLIAVLFGFFASPLGQRATFPSPADRLLGWKTLSQNVEDDRLLHGATWIGTTDYGVTGELAFYGDDPLHVQEIVDRQRYSFEPSDPQLTKQTVLLVVPAARKELNRLKRCFSQMMPVGERYRAVRLSLVETRNFLFSARISCSCANAVAASVRRWIWSAQRSELRGWRLARPFLSGDCGNRLLQG